MRNPKRTAVTAAALMIGIALVAFVAVLGAGLTQSATRRPEGLAARPASVISGQDGYSPIDHKATVAAASAPGVTVATGLTQDVGRAYKKKVLVDGVDPQALVEGLELQMEAGRAVDAGRPLAATRCSCARSSPTSTTSAWATR